MTKKENKGKAATIKYEDITKYYMDILDSPVNKKHKKHIYALLEEEVDISCAMQTAVTLFKETQDIYFLERFKNGFEKAMMDLAYGTGHIDTICTLIEDIFEENVISDALIIFFEELVVIALSFAPVCNCTTLLELFIRLSEQHSLSILELYVILIQMYSKNDIPSLLIEFRKNKPNRFEYPRCTCQSGYWKDEGFYITPECEKVCDTDACRIVNKIIYFTAGICLYRIWFDATVWKPNSSYDLELEEHEKRCGYIEEAIDAINALNCKRKEINIELLKKQYEVFSNKYMHNKMVGNFALSLQSSCFKGFENIK